MITFLGSNCFKLRSVCEFFCKKKNDYLTITDCFMVFKSLCLSSAYFRNFRNEMEFSILGSA